MSWHCSFCKWGCAKLYKKIMKLDEQPKDMIYKHQILQATVDELKGYVDVNHENMQSLTTGQDMWKHGL